MSQGSPVDALDTDGRVVAFLGGSLLLSGAGFVISAGIPLAALTAHQTEGRVAIAAWLALVALLFIGLTGFANDSALSYFFVLPGILALAPTAAAVATNGEGTEGSVSFWLALASWLMLSFVVVEVSDYEDKSVATFSHWLRQVGAALAVTALYFRLGDLSAWPFAHAPLSQLTSIHALLDLRLVLGGLFVSLSLFRAVAKARHQTLLGVERINFGRLPRLWTDHSWIVAALLDPFVILANVGVFVAESVTNLLWKIIIVTGRFFARSGRELANVFIELAKSSKDVFALLAILMLLFLAVAIGTTAAPAAVTYVRAGTWAEAGPHLWHLAKCAFGLVLYQFGIVFVFALLGDDFDAFLQNLLHHVALSLALLAFGGVPLYVAAHFAPGLLKGFQRPGPFSVCVAVVVTAGIVTQLWRRLSSANFE
jgi:hypothetical protein